MPAEKQSAVLWCVVNKVQDRRIQEFNLLNLHDLLYGHLSALAVVFSSEGR